MPVNIGAKKSRPVMEWSINLQERRAGDVSLGQRLLLLNPSLPPDCCSGKLTRGPVVLAPLMNEGAVESESGKRDDFAGEGVLVAGDECASVCIILVCNRTYTTAGRKMKEPLEVYLFPT